MFHIHIDAIKITPEFESIARDSLGFWRTDFAGEPHGVECFAPVHHLTFKTDSGAEFRRVFDSIVASAEELGGVEGYFEGEYIACDLDIEFRSFDRAIRAPFRLTFQPLPENTFRESEIHVTMSDSQSHADLHKTLRAMGLMVASLHKRKGLARIYTAQGSRADIDIVLPALTEYLNRAGGSVDCSIKEERIVAWWKSSQDFVLPPVIGSICSVTEPNC